MQKGGDIRPRGSRLREKSWYSQRGEPLKAARTTLPAPSPQPPGPSKYREKERERGGLVNTLYIREDSFGQGFGICEILQLVGLTPAHVLSRRSSAGLSF